MSETKLPKDKYFPHYWTCAACAFCMGGEVPNPNYAVTCTLGVCEYCGEENETLTPWCDFDFPDHPDTRRVWWD